MYLEKKLVTSALTELLEREPTTRDKWLSLEAWISLLHIHYDFGSGIDFTIKDFKRPLHTLGLIHMKISAGNDTGIYCGEKFFPRFNEDGKKAGTQKTTFLLLASSKGIEPQEPKRTEDWKPALKVSQDIVDDTRRKSIRVSSF
jgi:hypothetical protein